MNNRVKFENLDCPHCGSAPHSKAGMAHSGRQIYRCRKCNRRHQAGDVSPDKRRQLYCPKCGPSLHSRAGLYRGVQVYCCAGCGHRHKPEHRIHKSELDNHPRPPCPKCGDASPSKTGVDYRYEKQAYRCRCCKHSFRIQLERFAPIADLDAIADLAIIQSSRLVSQLLEAGVFRATGASGAIIAKRFTALLAAEAYLTRLGDRDHLSLEDVVTRAVAIANEQAAAPSTISLRRVLCALPSQVKLDIAPCYELDRCKARMGSQ